MADINDFVKKHERRVNEIILKAKDEDLGSMLAYMSGFAGNNEFFDEVFWNAVENYLF